VLRGDCSTLSPWNAILYRPLDVCTLGRWLNPVDEGRNRRQSPTFPAITDRVLVDRQVRRRAYTSTQVTYQLDSNQRRNSIDNIS